MATIGLDIGTTGCKATVVDLYGTTICEDYREYDLILGPGGRVELDPCVVWNAVCSVLNKVCGMCGVELTSIAIASFGEAVVLLDKDGSILCNSIFFTDARGYEFVDEIAEILGRQELELRTGMPLNGMYTLPKLLWMRQNHPELFEQIHMILPYGAYVSYMLCAETVCDDSLASRTLLYDRFKKDWDESSLQFLGLTREQLPAIVPPGSSIGFVTKNAAAATGLPVGLRVVAGCHDQIAAALGAGVLEPGQAVDSIGSAECITAMLPVEAAMRPLLRNHLCAEPYPSGSGFVSLMFCNTAGAALKWYRANMETERAAICKAEEKNIFKLLDRELGDDPSPLLFLPHLSGSGTPYMDASSKGIIYGLTLSSSRRDIYRALIEGINYEMRVNLEIFARCGLNLSSLAAVGGGAAPAVLQIKADILGLPVRMLENPQSGNTGLCMLCAVAEGRYGSLQQAAAEMVRVKQIFEPQNNRQEAYHESFELYRKLYQAGKFIKGESF